MLIDYCELQKKLNNIQEKKTPKTFLAILDKTYNEVIISKYLAYFLDERKTSRTIIENILKQTSKNESVDFVELLESASFESVETEIPISQDDRLDILIKYSNFWIVIENKIYAFESKDEQTVNYEIQIKNANTNKLPVKFIYLKPEFNKSKPSNPKFIEFLYKDLVRLFQQLNKDDLKDQENYIYLQDFIKHIKEFLMKGNNLFTDKKTLEFYLDNKSKIDYIINVYQEESHKIRKFIVENIVSEFPGFKVYDTAAFIQIFKDNWENYEHNGIHFEILPNTNKSFDELLGGKIGLKFTLHNEKKTRDKYPNIVHKSYMQAKEFTFGSNDEVQKSVNEILKQLHLMTDKYEVDIDTEISQKLIQG